MVYFEFFEVDCGENIAMRSSLPIEDRSGILLGPQKLKPPVSFVMEFGEDNFYAQYSPGFSGEYVPKPPEQRLKTTYNDGSLMSLALAKALRATGANLEIVPADISIPDKHIALPEQFVFVNVLGIVDCAHREGEDRGFVVNEEKIGGKAMLRLASAPSTIIVNAAVAEVLSRPCFAGVRADKLPSF